jgi:hypothetical protein
MLCAYLAVLPACGLGWIPAWGPRWLVDCVEISENWWLTWLGIPVAMLGVLFYGVLLVVLRWTRGCVSEHAQGWAWRVLTLMALLLGGSSLWFLSLENLAAASPCRACELVQLAGLVVTGALLIRGPLRLRRRRMPRPDLIKIRRFGAAMLGLVAGFVLMVFVLGQVVFSPHTADASAPAAQVPVPAVAPAAPGTPGPPGIPGRPHQGAAAPPAYGNDYSITAAINQ